MNLRTLPKTISLAAILVSGAATAFAQQPQGQPSQPSQSSSMPSQPGSSSLPDTSSPGTQSTPSSMADQAFVQDILKDNQAQEQLSQLAQQKTSSDDVKQFSQRMIQIHTSLDDQLKPIAKRLEVSDSDKPSKQEKQELAKLEQLSGADFDTAYLQAMVKFQQHSLKEFRQESEGTQDPVIQKATKADTPVLDQNFQVLQQLAQTHNVTIADNQK
jgi:putative membrane protein